ncbi:FAD binding domain [Lecanosticta acicola]|uniref:FAD binding domain n=1 Tax=Lecanosticta acicola TaxID=111012 RepID=A0AAI8YRI0_9PEZI|nr:FAD binding domain [Lecanosticta acicola]
MKVIIVGGGVAGLTLANALEKADIDFVLLESRALLDPQVGASIGIAPSSMRIFDQLGAAQEIMDQTTPIQWTHQFRPDGSLVMPSSPSVQILQARFGYSLAFLDRQLVLRATTNSIHQKEKLLLNKRVKAVVHSETGVVVECEDGSSYDGDLVVGCDGVHSKVRQEMWRLAGENNPEHFTEKERSKMTAEFICLYGISNSVPGIHQGDLGNVNGKGSSFLVIGGKDGRVFWFYFEKLDKVYHYHESDFPRYSREDAEKLAEKMLWRLCYGKISFRTVWEQRLSYTLVPMEEALFEKWSWGRIATVGDSAHKMTANHGQAGNNAIESVTALANSLKRLHDKDDTSSLAISSALQGWREKRRRRIEATCKEAAEVCRAQCCNSLTGRFLLTVAPPSLAEKFLADTCTDMFVGAELLEYLPLPDRAFDGSCPFNQHQGTGSKESKLRRVFMALGLIYLSYWVATRGSQSEDLSAPAEDDRHWKSIVTSLNLQFTLATLYFIWIIESSRRANAFTPMQIPSVFASLGLKFGVGIVAPIYYFLHYTLSSIEKFAPADNRLTNVAYSRTAAASVFACPLAAMVWQALGLPPVRGWACYLIPVHLALAQWFLVKTGLSKTNVHEDAMTNPWKDLPFIRVGVYMLSISSTLLHWVCILGVGGIGATTNHDVAYAVVATTQWLALLFVDLKSAGMVRTLWGKIFLLFSSAALTLGPAATLCLGWWWREQVLTHVKEKHAVTREKYSGKSIWEVAGLPEIDEKKNVPGNGYSDGHAKLSRHVKSS